MDFINNADDEAGTDDRVISFVPAAKSLVFRSRRAALRAATVHVLPVDDPQDRTRSQSVRITPRPPTPPEDRPFSLFKTVSAMRAQDGRPR